MCWEEEPIGKRITGMEVEKMELGLSGLVLTPLKKEGPGLKLPS